MTESDASTDNQPETEPGWVDLSDLKMMPAWVSAIGKEEKIKQRYGGRDDDQSRRDAGGRGAHRGGFGDRDRRGGPPPRRDGPGGSFRPRGEGGPRREGDDRRGPPRRFGDRDRSGAPQREWIEIPRDVQVLLYPDDKAVDALAVHVRQSGHAFSMFDASRLVLAGGDRFVARYRCAEDRPEGLFQVSADGSLFLTRDEALAHVLCSGALDEFYRAEEVELEAPKGEFTSVAVCGMSGELIAPPSHHSYQTGLIRLHRERFAKMPFEDFKRRVKVESSPELVAKWKENMTKSRRWVCLKTGAENADGALTLNTRAEMEAHFRRTFGSDAVIEVRESTVQGDIDKLKLAPALFIMLRQAVDAGRKHLFEISQKLGAGLERRGLRLFKRRAGKQYVSRVKPRAVEKGMVFSDRLADIVALLKNNNGMTMQALVEAIMPSPPPMDGADPNAPRHPTAAQVEVIKDIRWLANEGYVIEYSDGMVFLGVQGEPQQATVAKKNQEHEETAPTPENSAEVTSEAEAPLAEEPAEALVEEAPPAETTLEDTAEATDHDAGSPSA